jgi:CBS domain-containing protein
MKTQVKEIMKSDIELISPDATLAEAAHKMKELECGVLPVGTENKIEGVITDRDIVVRAISEGKNPKTEKVRDHMTEEVLFCGESDILKDAVQIMHDNNVSRLLVKDSVGKARGILTFGSILRKENDQLQVTEIVACAVGNKAA